MGMWLRLAVLTLAAGAMLAQTVLPTVLVDNPYGDVTAHVVAHGKASVRSLGRSRPLRAGDVELSRQDRFVVVQVRPEDGAKIDIFAEIPYNYRFQAKTARGSITIEGQIHRAEIITESGDLRVAAPLEATRVEVLSEVPPHEIRTPPKFGFRESTQVGEDGREMWYFQDKLPPLKVTTSKIIVNSRNPGLLRLEDAPAPDDWPIKPPWLASGLVDELLVQRKKSRQNREQKARPAPITPRNKNEDGADGLTVEEAIPTFRSEVRMVNLNVAVFDSQGRPLTDLDQAEFEVVEDGVPQRVSFVGSDEAPFNLALLLDMSGSTRRDREAMRLAAQRFIGIARPQDKTAVYALANNLFQQVSALGTDRALQKKLIEEIPEVSGGTPLYDMIVLAYAHELRDLGSERNALIVISDGVDNRVYGIGTASETSFKDLRRAAEVMDVLIYPIFLDQFTAIPPPKWAKKARENMEELASLTGGRLFVARSVRDLDPVYPLVAEELRSVYTIAYYPSNQDFDESWRDVEVRIKRPGVRIRTRAGYFAK